MHRMGRRRAQRWKVVSNAAIKVECPVIGTDLVGEISDGPWKGKTNGRQSYAADKSGKIIGAGKDRDRDIVIVKVKL